MMPVKIAVLIIAHLFFPAKKDTAATIPDTLLFKIRQAQAAITMAGSHQKDIERNGRIRAELNAARQTISPIQTEVFNTKKTLDVQTLLGYKLVIKDLQGSLDNRTRQLTNTSKNLQDNAQQILSLSRDSLLLTNQRDSNLKQLYTTQLNDIRLKLQEAGKVNTAQLDTVNHLLADVSAFSSATAELQLRIDKRLQTSGQTVFHKESPYLWSASKDPDINLLQLLKNTYEGQNKTIKYFFNTTWDNRLLLIITTVLFFIWINFNFRKASQPENRQKIGELNFTDITLLPFTASLVFYFNLVSLFEPHASAFYIEINQLLLLSVMTLHFYKQLSRGQFQLWLSFVLLYIVLVGSATLLQENLWIRLWFILINIISLYIGWIIYKKLENAQFSKKLIKPVLLLYFFLHGSSIVLNISGRVSLAGLCSITAIVGLSQVIGLALFIRVLSEALELQIKVSACTKGLFSRINVADTRKVFRRLLVVIAILIWLLVFFINLNASESIFSILQKLLEKPRTFGSLNFTLGNILFFTIIIYLSNLLQKYIGILFGAEKVTFSKQTKRKDSKLSLVRLVIIIAGVMLAVTASGIPIDKLTVVLGAFGVGIGLGMQNIVNNFVSGIILMFEKPFQIGDYVELADKKGKIKDIGIRSSKMLTQQGSEVIIPNGDLLSGRLVNWTLSNNYLRTEILIKVHLDTDLSIVNKMIVQEVSHLPEIIKNLQPEILINAVAADNIELKILVWITSIYSEPNFKSQLITQLLQRFKAAEIKVM